MHRYFQRQLIYSNRIWNCQNGLFVVTLHTHYTVPFITVLVECVPRTWPPELWKCGHIQLSCALKRYLFLQSLPIQEAKLPDCLHSKHLHLSTPWPHESGELVCFSVFFLSNKKWYYLANSRQIEWVHLYEIFTQILQISYLFLKISESLVM